MKKSVVLFSAFLLFVSSSVSGVEWPQEEHNSDSIVSYFAQNIGGRMSTSIIFADPAEVKAVKEGKVLIVMSDDDDDTDFFPSALGTSVIIAHDDELISVYSNLDSETVNEKSDTIKEGEIIGSTGNSGWQEKRSSLNFQIIDIQKSSAINPKILLPRTENEKDYNLSGIVIQGKDGVYYDLKERKQFPSGTYKVYHSRNKVAAPYKITATINGVVLDELSFDTIGEQNGKLYITGKKQYTSVDLYPDSDLILSGEIMLTPGKFTLGLSVENFLGKTKQATYILSIY